MYSTKINIFLQQSDSCMKIRALVDPIQGDVSNRNRLAICPNCGQKLVEIVSLDKHGVIRSLCRRCKNYVIIYANEDTAQ